MKFAPLSVIAKVSSSNEDGVTALADPPLAVVGKRKICSIIAPVVASSANAETYPVVVNEYERVAAMRYFGESLFLLLGTEKSTSSPQ